MTARAPVPDTLASTGDRLHQVIELLMAVQRLSRIAGEAYGRHVQDTLTDLQDEISNRLAAIRDAEQDDIAEADETGEVERERQSYFHPYRAA